MTSPAFFSAAPPMNHHRRIHLLTARNDSSHLISLRTCTASASASACACASASSSPLRKTRRTISPSPIRASTNSTATVDDPTSVASSSATASLYSEEDEKASAAAGKIGARVRVKGPLKVYHIPKVPELELTGIEGVLKQYVGEWKGKRISANLPYKIAFVADIGGREGVKFVAHLKEDEFEYLEVMVSKDVEPGESLENRIELQLHDGRWSWTNVNGCYGFFAWLDRPMCDRSRVLIPVY
ncbi:hypothetical protein RJ639_012105 [Escallonia herrerae]|uniref:Ferredoxin thioredoxin reductase alpha chain domain-containing protein n=1 Tax=Escallonia herrerae TaxID=1293975 RepID=A0AA89ATM8_9ASTE|nr:hypothetical protein RJ639_012105 [Escallonia herrerae]